MHIDEQLWPYQIADFRGKRYSLTRLGFGLDIALLIMRSIVNVAVSQDDQIRKATSVYIDNQYIKEDIASATSIAEHLVRFRLVSKASEWPKNGAWIFGLDA